MSPKDHDTRDILRFGALIIGLIFFAVLFLMLVAGRNLPADEAPTELPAELAAKNELIENGLAADNQIEEIELKNIEVTTWPDSCLGLQPQGSNTVCAQAIVDGYRIELEYMNEIYVVRTDRTGQTAIIED